MGLTAMCEFPRKQPILISVIPDFGASRDFICSIAEFRETPEIPCESKPKWHTCNTYIRHEWCPSTSIPSLTSQSVLFHAAQPSRRMCSAHCLLCYCDVHGRNVLVMTDDGLSCSRTFRPPLSLETSLVHVADPLDRIRFAYCLLAVFLSLLRNMHYVSPVLSLVYPIYCTRMRTGVHATRSVC